MCANEAEIVFIAGGVIGFILNIVEIMLILRLKKKLKTFEKLLLSLSIADVIVATTTVIFYALKKANVLSNDEGNLFIFFLLSTADIPLIHIFAITVDRFLAVKRPLQHNQRMQGKLPMLLITILWTLSILNVITFIAITTKLHDIILIFIQIYGLLLLALGMFYAVVYAYMFRIVLLRRAKLQSDNAMRLKICSMSHILFKRECKRERHMMVTSILVVVANIICTYPIFIEVQTVDGVKRVSSVTQLFLLASTICDPLVYFYKGLKERYNERINLQMLKMEGLTATKGKEQK